MDKLDKTIKDILQDETAFNAAVEVWVHVLAEIHLLWDQYAIDQTEKKVITLPDWVTITINLNRP